MIWLLNHEPVIRLGTFPAFVAVMALWEVVKPYRRFTTAMFNHEYVRIASRLDRVMRWFVVTPDMHRVHLSVVPQETINNFWPRITYLCSIDLDGAATKLHHRERP